MREGEPRERETLAESIEAEYGVNLEDQIRALRESGEPSTMELTLQKLQTLLIEAGVELTPQKKRDLRRILQEYGY